MAIRPKKPCNKPGCPKLVNGPYCDEHTVINKKKKWQRIDRDRESSTKRGYGYKWKKARDGFLAHNPLCAQCLKHELTVAANVVDHVIPHKGDMKLFWDRSNWQALCKRCHDQKTWTENYKCSSRNIKAVGYENSTTKI